MWDMDKADKTQTQMDSLALKLDKQRQDLAINNERYGLTKEPGSTSYWKTDLTNLQDTYKNSASFKNNNPGNIKFTDTFANTLSKYGIKVSKWSWAIDWGNFAKFNSIEDALQGRQILLFKTATYPNMTVDDAMKRYSNSWYWAEVSNVDWNKLMKDLSTEERSNLIMWQLQREDPNMYKELLKQGIDPSKVITKPSYKKTGLSSVEKKAQTKWTTSLNFAKYVTKEKNNIVEWLKWDKLDNVIPTLSTLYPTQNNPLKSIGRTLNKLEKKDIMSNIIKQWWLSWDSKVSEINDIVEKYASLFYPNKTLSNIEHTLWQDFLDSMNIWDTEWFLNARQNLREKYNDQFN